MYLRNGLWNYTIHMIFRFSIFFQTYLTGYPHALQWSLLQKYWGKIPYFMESYNISPRFYAETFPGCRNNILFRAEAYCFKDSPDYGNAGKDLGTLRAARYSSYSGGVSVSEKNALEVIEEERVKELYMEGFRLQDLKKRWPQRI